MENKLLTEIDRAFIHAARLLRASARLKDTAPDILDLLGRAMNGTWGTFWLVDSRMGRMVPIAVWDCVTPPARSLDKDTEDRTLSLSEGTAGHVWKSGRPVWTTNLVRNMCLPRCLEAQSAGLAGGVWFALKTDDAVYGVIELLGPKILPPSKRLLTAIEALGIKMGSLLERQGGAADRVKQTGLRGE